MIARLFALLKRKVADARQPDFIVGGKADPYLLRWWVIPRNRWFNIYLHCFLRSDDDRALHDHPWFWTSILLDGQYTEHRIQAGGCGTELTRFAGSVRFSTPWAAHRVELRNGPAWTLFIMGPVLRTWGFHCPRGWLRWERFVAQGDKGAVGPGCDG